MDGCHEIKVNCPFCLERVGKRDTKRKLWINPERGLSHCFRCGYATRNLDALAAKLGLTFTLQWSPLHPDSPVPRSCQLPPEFRTDFRETPIGREAWRYLQDRQLTPLTIAAYNIGYCITGRCAGRVLIPVYQQDVLVNYQARALSNDVAPKYLGPEVGGTPNVVFNLDRAASRGVLLLVEGMFDALRIPEYGVALLGKGWNRTKAQHIIHAKPHSVLICLDADAKADEERIRGDLAGMVRVLERVELDAKDLSEASTETVARIRTLCRQARLAAAGATGHGQPPPHCPL